MRVTTPEVLAHEGRALSLHGDRQAKPRRAGAELEPAGRYRLRFELLRHVVSLAFKACPPEETRSHSGFVRQARLVRSARALGHRLRDRFKRYPEIPRT